MAIQHTVYFGTYTGAKSKGIYRSFLDAESGHLGQPELVDEIKNPSFLAISPNGRFLYAALEAGGGSVGAWAIGQSGELSPINRQSSGGDGACHVWVDNTGRNVLVANYGGGSIACLPVRADGSLDSVSSFIQHVGSGPNRSRQAEPHAHSIYTDASNQFVYACDLGTDEVKIYRFDAAGGTLTPNEPPAGKVPPGSGPRHFAMHPDGFAYANNELTLTVTAFKRDSVTGALEEIETVPTFPQGASLEKASTAEMFLHPTGRWLYVSNRGLDTITVFTVEPDGTLTSPQGVPTPVEPRGFAISPDGKWLVAGGQNDDRVAVYAIDSVTGGLQPTGQSVEVGSP
ncbi:MAG TPA: lactonase family protein, partial [Abditibacteriaceae bacterium]